MISSVYTPMFLQYMAFYIAKGGESGGERWLFAGSFAAFYMMGCYGIISYTSILLP